MEAMACKQIEGKTNFNTKRRKEVTLEKYFFLLRNCKQQIGFAFTILR